MLNRFFAIVGLAMLPAAAFAANITIPSFTLTGPVSTGGVCTPTAAASGPASAAPVGTVIFNCVVNPTGWVGTVSINDAALQVVGLSGTTFNLALVANGVAQTYPAGTSATAP